MIVQGHFRRDSLLDETHLFQRWNDSCSDTAILYTELREPDFRWWSQGAALLQQNEPDAQAPDVRPRRIHAGKARRLVLI
ncbi:hypothetical protein [Streptomyces sp. NPDC001604]|uniref:hypothetical protein n=1 Tax=Streptomyces sp. NPDC001604 TaxID=3364593 RepID=UPI0036B81BFD